MSRSHCRVSGTRSNKRYGGLEFKSTISQCCSSAFGIEAKDPARWRAMHACRKDLRPMNGLLVLLVSLESKGSARVPSNMQASWRLVGESDVHRLTERRRNGSRRMYARLRHIHSIGPNRNRLSHSTDRISSMSQMTRTTKDWPSRSIRPEVSEAVSVEERGADDRLQEIVG